MQKLIVVISIIYLTVSCKKKAEMVNPNPISLITSSTSKVWVLTNITTNGKSIIDNCAKDDEYEFIKASSTINYNPFIKCYESDNSKELAYQIGTDQKSILVDGVSYKIETLTTNKMILSHDDSDGARISTRNSILHAQQTLTFIAK